MFLLIIFIACTLGAIGVGAMAAWSDYKGLTIPNLYSVFIIGAFVLSYGVLWMGGRDDVFLSLASHVSSFLVVFIATVVMYNLKALGGGDSKLMSAFALWVGIQGLFPFLFYMSIIGGGLGLVALILKKYQPVNNAPEDSWVAQCQSGHSKVPYGIAIFGGALASFINLGYFNPEVFTSFLLG